MKDQFAKLLNSRTAVTGLFLVVALSLAFNTVKVVLRNYELQQEVDTLADEVSLIELRNQNLRYNIEYYKTDAFLETEAKRRLNLAAPGEKVVLLPKDGDIEAEDALEQAQEEAEPKPQYQENFENWMIFLFGKTN